MSPESDEPAFFESGSLHGKFVRDAMGDKTVFGWTDDAVCAYIFLEVRDGLECATQVTLTTDVPDFADKQLMFKTLMGLLEAWSPTGQAKELTARTVRGVPLASIVSASRGIRASTDRDSEIFGFDPKISIHFEDGRKLGYKSAAAYSSAVEQAFAAVLYDSAVSQGDAKPVQFVAERLCEGDSTRARNLVTRARRSGLLTRGNREAGKSTSTASEDARALFDHVMNLDVQRTEISDER